LSTIDDDVEHMLIDIGRLAGVWSVPSCNHKMPPFATKN
jgi:hypothetical protein